MLSETLFNSWAEKEKRASQLRKRAYLHFDDRIVFNRNISFFKSYFSNPIHTQKHSFYPFIRVELETPRYKKIDETKNGKPIRKIETKTRPLAYAAHFDAFIYSFYSTVLTDSYEKEISKAGIYDNVLAYLEKGLSNIEFAHEIFQHIKSKEQCVALAFDVKSFFDTLDHEHLKLMWGKVLNQQLLPQDHYQVFKSLTDYTFVDRNALAEEFPFLSDKKNNKTYRICTPADFRKRVRDRGLIRQNPFKNSLKESSRYGKKCGIPQGSPISACLSNIYMMDFDVKVKTRIDSFKGIYRRYCDDIVVIVDHSHAEEVAKFIAEEIKKYHLELNNAKTEITYFKKDEKGELTAYKKDSKSSNLQYLGFEFNGKNAYIRSSSMARYFRRMTTRIRENLKAAYGPNAIGETVFKKKLYNRYTDKGERNFVSYAKRAAEHMNSVTIEKQYKRSIKKVKAKLGKQKLDFEAKKKPKRIMR